MFSDVSPDGQDEQGHDVSTHLPGPLGTILKFVQTFNHDEAAKEEKSRDKEGADIDDVESPLLCHVVQGTH